MTSGQLGSVHGEAASRQTPQVTSPRMLILAAAALLLTNIPLTPFGSGGHPDYFWRSVSVLWVVWRLWCRGWFAWIFSTAATAVTLVLCGLSIAGVIHTGPPASWIPITVVANILVLAILLSPPIRHWVAKRPT